MAAKFDGFWHICENINFFDEHLQLQLWQINSNCALVFPVSFPSIYYDNKCSEEQVPLINSILQEISGLDFIVLETSPARLCVLYCYHLALPSPGILSFVHLHRQYVGQLCYFSNTCIVMWGTRMNILLAKSSLASRRSCSWFSIHLYCTLEKG